MSKTYIDIPSEVAEELYETEDETEDGEFHFVTTVEGDSGRWRQHHTMVLRRVKDDTFWGISYELGLTENCDSSYPWRGEWSDRPESVVATRLYPREVTTTEYRSEP